MLSVMGGRQESVFSLSSHAVPHASHTHTHIYIYIYLIYIIYIFSYTHIEIPGHQVVVSFFFIFSPLLGEDSNFD